MVEHAFKQIRTGGLFSKRIKVLFETKLDRMLPRGEVNTTVVYEGDGSRRLGHCKYMNEGPEGKVTSFIMDDWANPNIAISLLKQSLTVLKKKGAKEVTAEIYAKDNTTHKKLDTFKKVKFRMDSGGATVGYNRYLFKKKL